MRMRSRSVAVPSAAHNNNNHHNLNNNNNSHVSSAATTGASRSVLNIPGELKLHYSEVVSVAEKLSRLFSRTHTYHVHRRHKTLRQEPSNSWVTVHNLKQLDGGILDPDDRLNDVADDREQIIAIYDEQTHHHHHHGGDGTSASSDSENPSPDIFQGVEHKFAPFTRNDIEITGEELSATPPPLHVRRGSEPALNRLSPIPPAAAAPPDPTKRWSAAPIIEDQNAPPSSTPMKMVIPHLYVQDGHSSYEDDNVFVDPGERGEGSGEEKTPSSSSSSSHHSATTAFTRFSRDTNRCSVQVLSDNPAMARWADAADRVVGASEGRRREPLGGSASSPMHSRDPSHDEAANSILVVLSNDRGPLGIHVIPSTDVTGHDQGLLVEGVEPGGRIARDGRIEVHDRIIEINGKPLNNITFQKAQEIFKDAMLTPELRLRVVKGQRQEWYAGQAAELVEGEEKLVGGAKVASVMSTRKVPPASLSSRTQTVILQSNTRKIGRRLNVHLTKGQHGLGFSITTRDNPAGGEAPIYIKNILPKGAAIEDGNLRIGDRLLEVNGVEVTGRSQSEVAALLREIPIGGAATLAVSRQDQRNGDAASGTADSTPETEKPASPKLPRQLPAEKAAEDSLMFPWKQREILMFEIPVHDSERAGLGVSVKGKTSSGPNGSVDLGIFVKNVIHGGAASRDGRLFQNDQLVNINGMSLLGKPNSEAMKTLRTAMHQEGPTPGIISLTVARRIDHKERSSPSSNNRSGRESANSLLTNSSGTETLGGAKSSPATPTPDHSGTTDASDTTVIFNDHKYEGDGHEIDAGDFGHINPVIQRLTGNNGALRNESYYKATHDTWNTSQLQQLVMRGERESVAVGGPGHNPLGSPTVNLPSRDTLIIHDDAGNHMSREICRSDGPGASAGGYSDHPSQSDDAYTSQTSLEENAAGFSRDQFGRQSMSEKRHATLDAKNTDTYQRNKKAREEREKQRQMMLAQEKLAASQGMGMGLAAMEAARNRELLSRDAAVMGGKLLVRASSDESLASQNLQRTNSHAHEQPSSSSSQHEHLPPQDALRSRLDVGPGLGMKKSSSLESLQTMVQEMALEEEGHRMGSGRVPRGRGCNESFRAAVDRSYDVPLTGLRNKMETLAEEESESSGSGFGRGNSRQSSVNSAVDDKYKKVGKKKPGIFKGLGSMFRFGKHRKSIDNPNGLTSKGDGEVDRSEGRTEVDRAEVERLAAARRLQQEEHDRMQEQYRRMIENTARSNQQQQQPQMRPDEGEPSRSERMHQLRAEHQRRHAQRNRTYPTDDLEERYESAIKQVLGESGDSEADKANNNTLNSTDTKPQVMSENIVHRRSKTPKPSSSSSSSGNYNKARGAGNPNRHSFHGTSSRSNSTGGTVNRNSLYVSCIKPVADSPSPPLSPTLPKPGPPPYVPPPNRYVYNDAIYSKPCKEPKNTSEKPLNSQPPSSVNDEMQVNNLSNFIIQNSLSRKPPLPPRNRPVNNNYKPPLPPSNPKPKNSASPSPVPMNQTITNQSSCKSSSQSSDFSQLNQINPNFTFSFSKSISGAVTVSHYPSSDPPSANPHGDVANRNFINQNLGQHNSTFVVYSSNNSCNGGGNMGMSGDSGSNRMVAATSVNGGGATYPNTNGNNCILSTAAPLSSNSSSSSTGSSSGAPRTNSLPRMGVKGKAAAMSARGSPCPPPPPPPKAAPNPLAALRSTAILDNSLFWRLDPVPSEPKPDIRHMRSHSYDLYGDNGGRPGSRTAYADPHKYSHYVNYEQIQQHLRKNKEQERLKKLASQQYQDFREKQTRRQQESSPTTLLHKLEETFIHESIIASREAREYQSQRGPRDSAREHQHRPVSNYYEYESVQAMISHAQDNSSTSLPRRHHPPPPGPPPVAAAAVAKNASNNNTGHNNNLFPGVSQPHHMMMYKQISGSSVHSTHSAHGGQMGNYGQTMSNMGHRGHNEHTRDMPHQEGLYGSSYRPASHYTGPHHKPPPPPPHHHTTTLTVPGSKV